MNCLRRSLASNYCLGHCSITVFEINTYAKDNEQIPRICKNTHVAHHDCEQTTTEMPSVTFLQYFILFYDENTSTILQDLGKYCVFLKFITTHVYCTLGENTIFSSKILLFSPKNTANLFARLASLQPGDLLSRSSLRDWVSFPSFLRYEKWKQFTEFGKKTEFTEIYGMSQKMQFLITIIKILKIQWKEKKHKNEQ